MALSHALPQLRHLNLRYARGLTDSAILELGKYLTQLLTLDLSQIPRLTSHGAIAVFRGCPLLQELRLFGNASLDVDALMSVILDELVHTDSPMTILDIRGCCQSTLPGLQNLQNRISSVFEVDPVDPGLLIRG